MLASVVLASLSGARDKAQVAAGQQFSGQVFRALGDEARAIWSFDSTDPTADESGNGNILTFANGATVISSGAFQNKSLDFNGSSQYTYVQNTLTKALFDPQNGSIALWIKPKSLTAASQRLFAHDANNGGGVFRADINNTTITMTFSGGVSASYALKVNAWTHLVFSWSNNTGNKKIYINGKEMASNAYSTTATISTYAYRCFAVGASLSGALYYQPCGPTSSNFLNATIDNFHVFSSAIQSAQVEQLYAEGLPRHQVADARER